MKQRIFDRDVPTEEDKEERRIGIRHMTSADVDYVCSSWYASSKRKAHDIGVVHTVWAACQPDMINYLIQNNPVLVAYDPIKPINIVGFICGKVYSPFCVIHYVYVRSKLRHFGIASLLMDCLGWKDPQLIVGSHMPVTPIENVVYNPFYTNSLFLEQLPLDPSIQPTIDYDEIKDLPKPGPDKAPLMKGVKKMPAVVVVRKDFPRNNSVEE